MVTGSWGNQMLLITNVVQTQNMWLPSTKKKIIIIKVEREELIIACIKKDQEWGIVSWFLSFTVIFSYYITSHFNEL